MHRNSKDNEGDALCFTAEDLAEGGINYPLHYAARNGHVLVCEHLIKSAEADVNSRDDDGEYPLHLAAEEGHVDVCKWLIANGADKNAKGFQDRYPIHYAALEGHVSVCDYLMESAQADVNSRDKEGSQPLHLAARKGHVDVCKCLIANGADNNAKGFQDRYPIHDAALEGHVSVCEYLMESAQADVNSRDKEGRQPLHLAARKGHVDVCKWLIANGADNNAKGFQDRYPIHYAAIGGHISVCEYLMESAQADVNSRDKEGSQPLHLAARKGHVDVCKWLIANGADNNAKGFQDLYPIHDAALEGHVSVCEYLMESAQADVNSRDKNGSQPLHLAACKGHVDVCKCLIANGADKNAKGFQDRYPIHDAALEGHVSVCEYLMESAQADVNSRDKEGSQPLHLAAYKGHVDVCKWLIANGADNNAKGFQDRYPIHYAALEGHVSVCDYLMESAQADVNSRDKEGSQLLHLAARKGHVDVCKCLIANGADNNAKGFQDRYPIHDAALEGHVSVCEYLMESAQADVNSRDKEGSQPLHLAACKGHVDVCKWLIANGADNNAKGFQDRYPIHYAALEGHVSVCEYLMESAQADVNSRDEDGDCPLHLAAEEGHVDVCKCLIANGADNNAKGFQDRYPIHDAALEGHVSVCEYLMESAQADVNSRDKNGNQPLHLAARKGHVDVCKCLIANGADNNAKGFQDRYPIHDAALEGHFSVCEYLMESAQADVNSRDEDCPLHLAAFKGYKQVCVLLLKINSDLLKVCNSEGKQAIHLAFNGYHHEVFSYLLSLYTDEDLRQETGIKLLEMTSDQFSHRRQYAMICSFLSRRAVEPTLVQNHWETLGTACVHCCDKEGLSYVFSCISEKQGKIEALKVWLTEAQRHGNKILQWLIYEGCKDDSGKAVRLAGDDLLWSSDARKDHLFLGEGRTLSTAALKTFFDLSSGQKEITRKEKASAKNVYKSLCENLHAILSRQNRRSMLKKYLSGQYVQELEDDRDFCNDNTKILKALLTGFLEKETFKKSEDILSLCFELVRNGADVQATDEEQKSLLHYAASDGREEMCRLLLERGANPLAKDASGKLAWELAFSSGNSDLAEYLRKVGSIPEEILAEGGDAVNVYSAAFKDGAALCTFFRVDVVGKDGTGKTSLIKSLTRQKFNLKEPSTEGVEAACEVVVKETCNWAKIVEIRERKRVYDKAAAASVAKRLKEANPNLGQQEEDVFFPQADDVVSFDTNQHQLSDVVDASVGLLRLTLANTDVDEILEGVLSFLSEKEKEKERQSTGQEGETEWTAPSSEPLALTHCLPARSYASSLCDLSSASAVDMSKCSPSEEKNPVNSAHNADTTNDQHQLNDEADALDKDKETRHPLLTDEPSSVSDLSSMEKADLSTLQLRHYNEEKDADERNEANSGSALDDHSFPSSLSGNVSGSDDCASPSSDAVQSPPTNIDASTSLPASVEAYTKVYLTDPGALNQALSDIYIDFLDYGGQHIYYTTHFSFLNKEAIYFVVFDVSLPLGDPAKSTFRSQDGEHEEIAVDSMETNYDRLEEWLSSICVMEPPAQPSLPADGNVECKPPYIFLIGTHRDKLGRRKTEVQKFLKEQNNYLKKKFIGKDFYSHIIPASPDLLFYAVDNTKSSPAKKAKRDPSVTALEKDVEDFAKKLSRRIPLRWLKFEAYVRSLKTKNPDNKVISIEELREAAKEEAKVLEDEEFNVLIRFLTSRAVLLYHPLPGVTNRSAIVDVQWLAKVFQKVVTVHLQSKTPRDYYDDLERAKCKGIVTSAYLNYLLSDYSDYQKEIKELLIFFDIICPYQIWGKTGDAASDDDSDERDYVCLSSSNDDDRRRCQSGDLVLAYFVPCLLTKDEKGSCAGRSAAKPLVLFSRKYRIPQTLFYRIMTRLADRFGRYPQLHPCLGYFRVYYHHQLEIRLNKYSISFTVFHTREDEVVSQICSRVREFVVATANDCKRNGMAGLELHLGCLADDSSSVAGESFFCVDDFQSGKIVEASEYSKETILFWHPKADAVVEFSGSARKRSQVIPSSVEASFGPVAAFGPHAIAQDYSVKNINVNIFKIGDMPEALKIAERAQTTNEGVCTSGILSVYRSSVARGSGLNSQLITWETLVAGLVGSEPHSCIRKLSVHLDGSDVSGDNWKRLARQLLDESEEKIKIFEQRPEGSPTIDVLQKWVQQSEPHAATVRALVNALTVIYRMDAAQSVDDFVEQSSGGRPILTWRKIVAPIVTDEEKSQELAAALGIKYKASCTADSIILSWMKRDLAEATVEALLRACREIGIFEEVQAAATRKKLSIPSISMTTEQRLESSRKRRQSSDSDSDNSLAKKSTSYN